MHHETVARKIRVITELGADLPPIRADRVELPQVLINFFWTPQTKIGLLWYSTSRNNCCLHFGQRE